METFRPIGLLLTVCFFTTYSFGQTWKQYADSAKIFQKQKKTDKAIEFYIKSKEALKKDSLGTISYAICCDSLATLYYYKGQYDKAEYPFLEAKQTREIVLGKTHPDYATSCNNIANIYIYIGHYKKAELLFLEAKQIREKALGIDHPEYATSCNKLAITYQYMGRYDKAEPLFLKAKQIREKVLGKDHPDYAASYSNLAALYVKMGQYEKAEPLHLEAKQIREKVLGKDHPDYAVSCNNLALLYKAMGQYDKAEPLHLEAKQIREKVLGKDHPTYASTCNNLAGLYVNMGQYEKAEILYLEAKQIQKRVLGKDHPDYAASCNNIALLYMSMGQYDKAEPLLMEAKQIREKKLEKDHPTYASSCNNLADLYRDIGQYEKAEPLYLEARQIYEKALGKQYLDYGTSCNNLGNLYRLTHQPLLAEKEYEAAFPANAYNVFNVFRFTNEKEKAAYIRNVSGEDESALSFYASRPIKSSLPYSLSLFHRNLILSASQALKKQLFAAGDTTISNKYNEWVQLKKMLSAMHSRPIAERKVDLAQMEERAGQLEKDLTRLSSYFAKQQQQVDWKDIQAKLRAGEASIEFASFHWNNGKQRTDTVLYVALILRKDSLLPAMVPLFNEQQLQDLLPAAGNKTTNANKLYALRGTGNNRNWVSNKSIYDLIWKPMEKELKSIDTVYFAPSALLHRISFAALPINNTQVLSDRYKLVQLATTAFIADQQPSFVTDSDKIQLYGGISYDADTTALKAGLVAYHDIKTINRSLPDDVERSKGWNDLPGTKKELSGIVSLSNAYKSNITTHFGIDATEESLKALDGKASPAVIHIATHGFFFPDPKVDKKQPGSMTSGQVFRLTDDPLMRSGLLFTGANHAWKNKGVEGIDDGILTAYEVANLYLPNTKLVVLSACETGLGDIQGNEGVYGLQRAFKIAGAQSLVMSLWKVQDAETAEFMQAFYKNLFAKQAIDDAFYGAQKAMKDKYRSHPKKWAAWVLVR